MYKKSLLAMALTSAAFSNVAMAAPTADIYGFVDIGLEHFNNEGITNGSDVYPGGDAPNGNSDEQEFALANNVQSRLGIKGEEAIEGGWKGTYKMEFRADVLTSGGYGLRTRLGWLGLEKGDHSFKVGTQWSPYMAYSAWNTARGESQGLASYFYVTTTLPGSLAGEFRNSSTISYTYGNGGWGQSSPFSATVALHVGDDDRKVTDVNDNKILDADGKEQLASKSGITGATVAGAATFGPVTVNSAYVKTFASETDAAKAAGNKLTEPSIYSVGAKYQATPELELGFAYRGADQDLAKDSIKTSTSAQAQYQINKAWNIHVGYGIGEDENKANRQLDSNVYAQLWYQATDSRSVRFEFEQADYGKDGKSTVSVVSLRQTF
jgi:predicted porin